MNIYSLLIKVSMKVKMRMKVKMKEVGLNPGGLGTHELNVFRFCTLVDTSNRLLIL